jgi:hypothetical protein
METGVSRGGKEYKNMRHLNQSDRIKIEHFLNMKYCENVNRSSVNDIQRNQKKSEGYKSKYLWDICLLQA